MFEVIHVYNIKHIYIYLRELLVLQEMHPYTGDLKNEKRYLGVRRVKYLQIYNIPSCRKYYPVASKTNIIT